MTTCPITGESLAAGETISRTAAARLRTLVSDLPALMEDATYALTAHRQDTGSGGVASSRPPLSVGLLAEIDDMRDAVDTWVAAVREWACPTVTYRPGDWPRARAILTQHADRLRRWEHAPTLIDELTYALRRIEHLTSPTRAERRFIGPCPECTREVMALPEAATVTCHGCGTLIDVGEALASLREALVDVWMPREWARRAAEIVTRRELPAGTLKTWVARGQLTPRRRPDGPASYRVGDIVELLDKKGEPRYSDIGG